MEDGKKERRRDGRKVKRKEKENARRGKLRSNATS